MRILWLTICVIANFLNVYSNNCTKKDSSVKSLSGLQEADLPCMYSGFISIDDKSNSQIFYWLIKSQNNDNSAPLVVWLNGGPGKSSLFGLFTEMGPLRITATGLSVEKTQTWTSKAHVLYIDQPVGTGYSFSQDSNFIPKNQSSVSAQFYRFIQKFFIQHQELVNNNLYIIGESYAGKYIPNIASLILEENQKIEQGISHNQIVRLKKIAIGNGLFDSKYQRAARKDLAKGLNIMSEFDDEPQYDTLVKNCEFAVSANDTSALSKCDEILDFVMDLAGDVFQYDIRKSRDHDDSLIQTLNSYLNKDDVITSLHVKNITIKSESYWSFKNDSVKQALKNDINLYSSIPKLDEILNNYDIPVILYAGQFDLVDGPQGVERAINSMNNKHIDNWKKSSRELWKIKTPDGQFIIAGYVKQFNNLVFITMRNAGQYAPRDRPGSSLNLLDHLFSNEKVWKCPDDKCSLVDKKCQAMKHCMGNGICSESTGGKCICVNGFFGPDCSIKPEFLLSKSVVKMSPRDTKLFNLTHYHDDILLEIDSDDHNILVSLVDKKDHIYIFNQKEHLITYRLINHKLLLFIEKERFENYFIVITNLEFQHEIELKFYVNDYSKIFINK